METIEFVCFTSACGGTGCSSSAVALARIMTKLHKRKVLVLSLDTMTEKMYPPSAVKEKPLLDTGLSCGREQTLKLPLSADDFGVSYVRDKGFINPFHLIKERDLETVLENISRSKAYDMVILDIPYKMPFSEKLITCCEKVVVVSGYLPYQIKHNGSFLKHLELNIKALKFRPVLYNFTAMEDAESFEGGEVDIHDQFGAEVRQLADKLYGSA
ncbi:MAG: hypothetical protein J5528_03605 [Firmicutes bacterium]|nr:hypothetical protein [Bacillota bacterium]